MDGNNKSRQVFHAAVGQVASGNIINIHQAPAQPDREVIRAVGELLKLAAANELTVTIQNIAQTLYGSTHFKGLKVWQLKKLLAVTQEIVVLVKPVEVARPWWKFW